jgi:hypothetical protein
MKRVAAVLLVLSFGMVPEAFAQFSSDIPGVPRASTPLRGGHQNRTEFDLAGYRLAGTNGDTMSFVGRIGFGQSYRVQNKFEIGYDMTIGEGVFHRVPAVGAGDPATYTRGTFFYGIRLGAKFRPVSSISPEGYGYELAIGAGYQPALQPMFGAEREGDSTRVTGHFLEEEGLARFDDPFASSHAATQIAGMASYRTRRVTADAAIVTEAVTVGERPSPTGTYDGLSIRLGAVYRLRPSISVGASYWGDGAPPWRGRIQSRSPAAQEEQFGVVLAFGSRPEAGTDLVVTSPTGDIASSARFYFRFRSTR